MTIDQGPRQSNQDSSDVGLPALVASIRRLTVAVWCLVGLFAVSYAAPWAMYLLMPHHDLGKVNLQTPKVSSNEISPSAEFDNDFSARPPSDQVKQATVILLTKYTSGAGGTRETVSEVVKLAPQIRFYYKVGDASPMPNDPSEACGGCEADGQVVLLQGNPARPAVSYTYRNGQAKEMGMSLAELRQAAQGSLKLH
jgi:hypothetical protein